LIVKEHLLDDATLLFGDVGAQIVTSYQFLGGVIGVHSGIDDFVFKKVQVWKHFSRLLPVINHKQLMFLNQNEWNFLQSVTPDCGHLFHDVEESLLSSFIPSLMGHNISLSERTLFSLPIHMGGLDIRIPMNSADPLYMSSKNATQFLTDAIKGVCAFSSYDHDVILSNFKSQHFNTMQDINNHLFSDIFNNSNSITQRSLTRNRNSLCHWLSSLPIKRDDFHLSAMEFLDALCLRYMKPLVQVPPHCDGCGSLFTTSHALDCRKCGLVVQRHHEIVI
jgi:hypothetical protein